MRKRTCWAAASVTGVLAVAVAGCAQAPQTSPAAGAASSATAPATPTPSAVTSPSATALPCAAPSPAAGALNLSGQDNGKTFCVTTGTEIVIILRGTLSDKWQPLRDSSGSVGPIVDPRMMLQAGVTGAAFRAIRAGVSMVTSVRYPCQRPEPADSVAAASSASPSVRCASSRMVFQVTLVVTAP